MFFNALRNTEALLQGRGLTTAPIYEREGSAYVKIGGSYHALSPNKNVRGTKLSWVEFGGDEADRLRAGSLNVEVAPLPDRITSIDQVRRALAAAA